MVMAVVATQAAGARRHLDAGAAMRDVRAPIHDRYETASEPYASAVQTES
jgi:hypothetical protein